MSEETTFDEILRFEVRPSFAPSFVTKLVQYRGEAERYSLRCELGRLCFNADRGSWETPVASDVVGQLVADLAAMRLPPIPDFAAGVDGTTYRLFVAQGWNELLLKWWGKAPSRWEPLVPVLKRLVALAGPRAKSVLIK